MCQNAAFGGNGLTFSLILHFETIPNSKKLQTTTEMWPLTVSQMTNFKLFQTERVSRRKIKFNENGSKFSKKFSKSFPKG